MSIIDKLIKIGLVGLCIIEESVTSTEISIGNFDSFLPIGFSSCQKLCSRIIQFLSSALA